jgi:hypothetical protein
MLLSSNATKNCQAGHSDSNIAGNSRANEFFNTITAFRIFGPAYEIETLQHRTFQTKELFWGTLGGYKMRKTGADSHCASGLTARPAG